MGMRQMNTESPNMMPVSELGSPGRRSQRGCFLYGCLIFAGVCFALLVVASVSLYIGLQRFATAVESVSEDAPLSFPVVESTKADLEQLEKRLKDFQTLLESDDQPIVPFELTELEVNQLIQGEDQLKGMIYIDFEPDQIKGELSLPLDSFADYFKSLKGKYLNGNVEATAEITRQGLLDVHIKNLTLGQGKTLPAEALNAVKNENLAKDVNLNVEFVKAMKKIERLEILKDKVRLVPRSSAGSMDEKNNATSLPSADEFEKAVDEFREGTKTAEEVK